MEGIRKLQMKFYSSRTHCCSCNPRVKKLESGSHHYCPCLSRPRKLLIGWGTQDMAPPAIETAASWHPGIWELDTGHEAEKPHATMPLLTTYQISYEWFNLGYQICIQNPASKKPESFQPRKAHKVKAYTEGVSLVKLLFPYWSLTVGRRRICMKNNKKI